MHVLKLPNPFCLPFLYARPSLLQKTVIFGRTERKDGAGKKAERESETFLFLFFNVYPSLRGRGRAQVAEGQREREAQNTKQAPGSELSAQSPTWALNPRTVRSRPEPKLDT